jgi:hypothetical protein
MFNEPGSIDRLLARGGKNLRGQGRRERWAAWAAVAASLAIALTAVMTLIAHLH